MKLCTPGALILVLLTNTANAQTYGEITGTVNDSSGAVLAAATVTITHVTTRQVRTFQTNETGNYTAPFLSPGVYDVETSSPGFKSALRKGVDLQVGQVA